MRLLDLTLPTPAENLALDEALLEDAEARTRGDEWLRLWEPLEPMVVVGRSSRVEDEVNQAACTERGIPILRRSSGGAAIITAPGCLMYAVVLSQQRRPELLAIDSAHRYVLNRVVGRLQTLVPGIAAKGTSDLVLGDLKFSGNSMRAKRHYVLYHGTLLYDFPLESMQACLTLPPRQPSYRAGRPHRDFVTNLPITRAELRQSLIAAWNADQLCGEWPRRRTLQLAAEKYTRPEWNLGR